MHRTGLSELQRDALNEVGNIGAGNASGALAALTGQRLALSVPQTSLVPLEELPLLAPCALEAALVTAYVAFQGEARGCLLLLFTEEQARRLFELLGLGAPGDIFALEELQKSAASEVGNIVASSYLNALAEFTGLRLLPMPPGVAVGMSGAILGSVAAYIGQLEERGLVIRLEISAGEAGLGLHLLMIPQAASLEVILEALGVAAG